MQNTYFTKLVHSVKHVKSRSPSNVAMESDFEWGLDPTLNLKALKILDPLTGCL